MFTTQNGTRVLTSQVTEKYRVTQNDVNTNVKILI
jgi:hypothetical protein